MNSQINELKEYKKSFYKAVRAINQVNMEDRMDSLGFSQDIMENGQKPFKYPENIERLYIDAGKAAELVAIVKEIKDELHSINNESRERKRRRIDNESAVENNLNKLKVVDEDRCFYIKTFVNGENGYQIKHIKAKENENKNLSDYIVTSLLLQKYDFVRNETGFTKLQINIPNNMYKDLTK